MESDTGSSCRHIYIVYQILGFAIIIIHTTAQPVLKKREVDTGIIGCRLFPRQRLVIGRRTIRNSFTRNGIVIPFVRFRSILSLKTILFNILGIRFICSFNRFMRQIIKRRNT